MGFFARLFGRQKAEATEDTAVFSGLTDVGNVRELNEDRILVAGDRGLFVVADGMGGHNAGDVAATDTVETVDRHLTRELIVEISADRERIRPALEEALQEAHRSVSTRSREDAECHGMGCAIVVGLVTGNELFVAHVGDARAYRFSEAGLEILTTDHSTIMPLVEAGKLTQEEARKNPLRSQLTQAIGASESITPDFNTVVLEVGDRVLLCSDGLWEPLSHEELEELVAGTKPPKEVCKRLVAAANTAGGHDNISVIVVDHRENKTT